MESIHCRASLLRRGSRSTSSPGLFPQKMGGASHPFFEGKALGTRLVPAGYPNKNRCNTSCRPPRPPPALSFFLPASLRHKEAPCGRKRGIAARVTYKLPRDLPSVHVRKSVKLDWFKWQIQGRGPRGPGSPLISRLNPKIFFGRPPPALLSRSESGIALFDMYKAQIATLIHKIFNHITPSRLEHLIVGRGERTSTT